MASKENSDNAIAFAKWLRDNCVADGAPKLHYRHYLDFDPKQARYTIDDLYAIYELTKE